MITYHVFDGSEWLADDEHTWTSNYHDAAAFNVADIAKDVGLREAGDRIIYVFGLLPA